jgi:hypothetical protein
MPAGTAVPAGMEHLHATLKVQSVRPKLATKPMIWHLV